MAAPYLTASELENWMDEETLEQLTDDDESGGVDTAKVDAIIAVSSMEVNAYVQRKYDITNLDSSVTEFLKSLVVGLVTHEIWARRGAVPADIVRRHEITIDKLEKIGRGEILLGSVETNTDNNADVKLTSDADGDDFRKYTENNLSKF